MAYTVAIVVDPKFGERLSPLAARLHVWICDTPQNRAAAEVCWREHHESSLGPVSPHLNSTRRVCQKMYCIDLHHGAYSHVPPWEALEIYGDSPTPAVCQALAEFGVPNVQSFPQWIPVLASPECRNLI